jgi:hypothetical protein
MPHKTKELRRQYIEETADRKKQYRRQQYLKHRKKRLKKYAKYRDLNRDTIRSKQEKYIQENPN